MKLLCILLISILYITPVKADELSCLAEAVYFEARSEPFTAQLAVANVVLERVYSDRYPDNVCDVVHQAKKWKGKPIRNKCQFSYWCDGKPEVMRDETAKQWAYNVAESTLQGIFYDTTSGATHYHADYVVPDWSKNSMFTKTVQINAHIFYRWER